ncbi:lysine 5,6-aminomutase reactivase subunit KamB [Porphyromonas gingivalis]
MQSRSISIFGMEKNTGKTETLNYIIRRLDAYRHRVALTSIGIDGEKSDQVTQTAKPEIVVPKGMIFVTSELHFLKKELIAEIIDVSEDRTALGRLITACSLEPGKILLSGPSTTGGLRKMITTLSNSGVQTTIVDGALSRKCLASPVVTDAMVLATGAALSINIPQLVRKTAAVYRLISLPTVEAELAEKLDPIEQGIWGIDESGNVYDLGIRSALMLNASNRNDLTRFGNRIYVSGAVSDNLLEQLRLSDDKICLIIRDFTRMFALPEAVDRFLQSKHEIKSLYGGKLLAVTINPVAPSGYKLKSEVLRREMEKALGIPVYDVRGLNTLEC